MIKNSKKIKKKNIEKMIKNKSKNDKKKVEK